MYLDIFYFIRSILLFVNTDVFKHILLVDTFILTKSNMGQRKYKFYNYYEISNTYFYFIPTIISDQRG
jgi:hypothetical protein